ncbi:MAG TPA: hypothetical protein VGI85_10235 [Chthoniobacterales bacterium]
MDNLDVFFLAQDEQTAADVMARLVRFINSAQRTLDLALYDMRLSGPRRIPHSGFCPLLMWPRS